MQQAQPLLAVEWRGPDTQPFEVVENVQLDTFQPGLGLPDARGVYAEGDVLGLYNAVVPTGELSLQNAGELNANTVKLVPHDRHGDEPLKVPAGPGQIEEGELKIHRAVKIVEKVAPALKDGRLIFVQVELVVDVLVLDGFGVMLICDPADAVRPHSLKRNAVLCGQLFPPASLCLGDGLLHRFFLCAGQLSFGQ